MVSVTHRTARRFVTLAFAAAAFALLVAPAMASAATVSGTVSLSSGPITAAHRVTVELWGPDPADPGYYLPTEYFVETSNGAFSIPNVDPGQYYLVAHDYPYGWYQMTVYPNKPVIDSWDPTDGTLITAGSGNPLNFTLQVLPTSFTGKVKDSKTGTGIEGITVETYYQAVPGEWDWDSFGTETAADGTYQLHGMPAGTYRLGFVDYLNGTYTDTYYNGKTSLGTANNVTAGAAPVALADTSMSHSVRLQRIAPTSSNFWSQAVNVTKRQFTWDPLQAGGPNYSDVTNVVIASGDSRAAADPLSAAGLCWAYQVRDESSDNAYMNAPLLLVSATKSTDTTVKSLIAQIATHNRGYGASNKRLTVHIVGGTGSVPDARFNEISAAVVAAGGLAPVKHRITPNGDRYTLSKSIALEMKKQAALSSTDSLQLANFALVANGADSTKFFDALALSPIAAANGAPILLVASNSVPVATSEAIASLGNPKVYVAGGVLTVSAAVNTKLKATRISGPDRYQNAIAIANKAILEGWLYDDQGMSIAATIADAQLGGMLAGNEVAPLLITPSTSLNASLKSWLTAKKSQLNHVYVVGSTTSLNATTYNAINAAVNP